MTKSMTGFGAHTLKRTSQSSAEAKVQRPISQTLGRGQGAQPLTRTRATRQIEVAPWQCQSARLY